MSYDNICAINAQNFFACWIKNTILPIINKNEHINWDIKIIDIKAGNNIVCILNIYNQLNCINLLTYKHLKFPTESQKQVKNFFIVDANYNRNGFIYLNLIDSNIIEYYGLNYKNSSIEKLNLTFQYEDHIYDVGSFLNKTQLAIKIDENHYQVRFNDSITKTTQQVQSNEIILIKSIPILQLFCMQSNDFLQDVNFVKYDNQSNGFKLIYLNHFPKSILNLYRYFHHFKNQAIGIYSSCILTLDSYLACMFINSDNKFVKIPTIFSMNSSMIAAGTKHTLIRLSAGIALQQNKKLNFLNNLKLTPNKFFKTNQRYKYIKNQNKLNQEKVQSGNDQSCITSNDSDGSKSQCFKVDDSDITLINKLSDLKTIQLSTGFSKICGIFNTAPAPPELIDDTPLYSASSPILAIKCFDTATFVEITQPSAINESPATHVSVGGLHSCITYQSSSLLCQGNNEFGQLDLPYKRGMNNSFQEPTATGFFHTCALRSEQQNKKKNKIKIKNKIKCWGDNSSLQLIPQSSRLHRNQYYNTLAVAAGGLHSCLLNRRWVDCWGDSKWGQAQVPWVFAEQGQVFGGTGKEKGKEGEREGNEEETEANESEEIDEEQEDGEGYWNEDEDEDDQTQVDMEGDEKDKEEEGKGYCEKKGKKEGNGKGKEKMSDDEGIDDSSDQGNIDCQEDEIIKDQAVKRLNIRINGEIQSKGKEILIDDNYNANFKLINNKKKLKYKTNLIKYLSSFEDLDFEPTNLKNIYKDHKILRFQIQSGNKKYIKCFKFKNSNIETNLFIFNHIQKSQIDQLGVNINDYEFFLKNINMKYHYKNDQFDIQNSSSNDTKITNSTDKSTDKMSLSFISNLTTKNQKYSKSSTKKSKNKSSKKLNNKIPNSKPTDKPDQSNPHFQEPSDYSDVVKQLNLGFAHSCILLQSGEIVCWGCNLHNQLVNIHYEYGWDILRVKYKIDQYVNQHVKSRIELDKIHSDEFDNLIEKLDNREFYPANGINKRKIIDLSDDRDNSNVLDSYIDFNSVGSISRHSRIDNYEINNLIIDSRNENNEINNSIIDNRNLDNNDFEVRKSNRVKKIKVSEEQCYYEGFNCDDDT